MQSPAHRGPSQNTMASAPSDPAREKSIEPDARSIFLARDRMGQKPLYFGTARDGRAIAFASELGALRGLKRIDWEMNDAGLSQYLQTGYVASPGTIYRGVNKLPPAN